MFLKNKKSKFHSILISLLFIIIISLIIGFFYLVFYSNFLKVNDFHFVYSNNYLKSDNVSGFFDNDLFISSLTTQIIKNKKRLVYLGPDNILFWKFGNDFDLYNTFPSIKNIEIDVNLFKKNINIFVEEKNLFGIFCTFDNKCYTFDNSGIIFAPAPQSKGSLILKINDNNERSVTLNGGVLPQKEWFDNMIKIINIIKNNNFNIESIHINDFELEEWKIKIINGPIILFSLDFIPSDLNEILKKLKERTDFSEVNYFDMRVENRIYYNLNNR